MTTATADFARPRRLDLHWLLQRRPELGAYVVIAAAWALLLTPFASQLLTGIASSRFSSARGISWMQMPGMKMPGMYMPGITGPANVHTAWTIGISGLPYWELMTVAMMGPAALAGVRHTGLNSLLWRRGRAMAEFALAYLAVWTAFGILAIGAVVLVPGLPGRAALAVVLAASAAWQVTPLKRRLLRECHRSLPLPPRGWRAERGALRFGLHNGLSCLGSCWCLMLTMVVAPGAHLLWTIGLTGVIATERLLKRPRRATRVTAVILGIAAAVTAAAAVYGLV
jgi:predicted metal-binding membrane protein